MMLRGNSIQYSSGKKKGHKRKKLELENEIKTLEQDIMQNFYNISDDNL